ncbi:hypothetical protein V8F06_014742 [Rhypophila decipiens]
MPTVNKKQKEGWEEEFHMEKAAYARLRPLQGIVIPEFLGEVRCDKTRAILLSDIGGACLATPEPPTAISGCTNEPSSFSMVSKTCPNERSSPRVSNNCTNQSIQMSEKTASALRGSWCYESGSLHSGLQPSM